MSRPTLEESIDRASTSSGVGRSQRIDRICRHAIAAERECYESKLRARDASDKAIIDSQIALIAELKRELHRWQHGQETEGDYVCPAMAELAAIGATHISREEVRRVFMGIAQAMGDVGDKVRAIDVVDGLRELGINLGEPTEGKDEHS